MDIVDIPSDVFIKYFMSSEDNALIAFMLYYTSKKNRRIIKSYITHYGYTINSISSNVLLNSFPDYNDLSIDDETLRLQSLHTTFLVENYNICVTEKIMYMAIKYGKSHLYEKDSFMQYAHNNSRQIMNMALTYGKNGISNFYLRRLKLKFNDIVNNITDYEVYISIAKYISNRESQDKYIENKFECVTMETAEVCAKSNNLLGLIETYHILKKYDRYNKKSYYNFKNTAIKSDAYSIYFHLCKNNIISKQEHELLAKYGAQKIITILQDKNNLSYIPQYYEICTKHKHFNILDKLIEWNYIIPSDVLKWAIDIETIKWFLCNHSDKFDLFALREYYIIMNRDDIVSILVEHIEFLI
jgi:hypothetical protein